MKHQIEKVYQIEAPVEVVWEALTSPQKIEQWGGGPVTFELSEGGVFSLWGGDIHGTNTKVVVNELLEQDWFGGDWDKPSKVSFILKSTDTGTELTLFHDNLPEAEVESFDDGWDDYYIGPLKSLVEG